MVTGVGGDGRIAGAGGEEDYRGRTRTQHEAAERALDAQQVPGFERVVRMRGKAPPVNAPNMPLDFTALVWRIGHRVAATGSVAQHELGILARLKAPAGLWRHLGPNDNDVAARSRNFRHPRHCLDMKPRGRMVICGMMSQGYADLDMEGPKNYWNIVTKMLRVEGVHLFFFSDRLQEGARQLAQWVQEGKLRVEEDVHEGFEKAPGLLMSVFTGKRPGKLILKVGDPA